MTVRGLCSGLLLGVCSIGVLPSPQQPVDLAVRHPAQTVRVLGVSHLVHELWITSRAPAPVTLSRVTVSSETRTLADYQEAELLAHVGRPGLPRTHPAPLVLEPDQQAVVYFWTALPQDGPAPSRVEHRVTIAVPGAPSSPRQTVARGGETRVVPADDAAVLDAPLRGQGWVAVYEPEMMGGHRTAIYTTDGAPRIPGRFAIDWIRLPPGATRMDSSSRPPDWNGFGAEVLAVAEARVADARDGRPDADAAGKPRVPITRDNAAGNYVSLDLGNGRFAFYEHLQEGSVRVKAGDRVARGQTIARLGSSGSVSSGPHLHFHVSNANSLLAAEGVPFVLRRFLARGAFASIGAFAKGDPPVPNARHLTIERLAERPAANAIVEFADPK
jgi:murein DD-endopeptidase